MTTTPIEPGPATAVSARRRVALMVTVTVVVVAFSLAVAWPWSQNDDMTLVASVMVLVVAYLVTGSMIALRQPSNALGWVLSLVAIFFALLTVSGGPRLGVETSDVRLWLSVLLSGWWAPPIFILLSVVPLIFPNGMLPSRRWRLVIWAAAIGSALTVATSPFDPNAVEPPLVNPIANRFVFDTGGIGALIGFAAMVTAMTGMVLRYRRATGVEREQLKLLVSGVVFAVFTMVLNGVLIGIIGEEQVPALIEAGLLVLSAAVLAAAIGVAILRHKLFDINLVISKALVYGALVAVVTAVYVGVVVLIGNFRWYTSDTSDEPNRILTGAAVAVAVLLLQPLRSRAQRLANRLVYGKRATPYEALSHLSEQLRDTFAGQDLLGRIAEIVARGTGATEAAVWVRAGSSMWTAASWPAGLERREVAVSGEQLPAIDDATLSVPVVLGGELLGALSITKPPNDPISTTEERLVTDLGAQAGLVLRNVSLTQELLARLDELKASRQRLVKAQDQERRRLERDLHDGAQQMLVALKVNLGLATRLATDEQLRAMLEQAVADTGEALETVRDLARGIYPPLLASDGLVAALRSQASKATIPVEISGDGIGRYPQEAEAAVYFCVLEALQNVQKYAEASSARVRITDEQGLLRFEVRDDGRGFDPSMAREGSGTQNMRDRLAALDGELSIASTPGRGTVVSGQIPASRLVEAVS